MSATPTHQSLWMNVRLPEFSALQRDIDVDVLIVGAGVTGITTAYLMGQEGVRVALIEREKVASADSARTTAHLTYVTDERLHHLVSKFGVQAARKYWEGGIVAIDTIERITEELGGDAEFVRVPGYLHARIGQPLDPKDVEGLRKDAELAQSFGIDATFADRTAYSNMPGVRFAQQAKFHPRRYLKGLLTVIQQQGGLVFENTAFESVDDGDPMTVHANGHKIRCKYLVIATHNPRMGKKGAVTATLFQTKLALYTSYVLGARLPDNAVPEGVYWDTGDPYEYLRIEQRDDHQYAIFGGQDVKTGQEDDPERVFDRLTVRLREVLPQAEVERRWLGQVVETDDGMPFIGENEEREFIATGFSGNGWTLGTLSALMARDRFLGRDNPWRSLLAVGRSPFHGGAWRYVQENADFPYYFVRDRLRRPELDSPDQVGNGEGRIVSYQSKKVAAYRDDSGQLTLLAPQCTHLKCLVKWNSADRTWDCPCHGSRFRPTGEVLGGPAEQPLKRLHE
ncbi:FAD-dependent oxidoreductase [Steroidobacter agaridevorans]|uniref:FAD-dependent oxidoreductase n=1 Tax=Steroidobacter agaridevorans TaxID=2695856 RepID=UPI001324C74E|nr:FAD-dependent oxidoreductase [Steroidobacter agaridevorans]GFE90715.1 oxidoreductase [Steroidobacter agaridevorans]